MRIIEKEGSRTDVEGSEPHRMYLPSRASGLGRMTEEKHQMEIELYEDVK